MTPGTIKLYSNGTINTNPHRRELERYYTVEERKRIIEHWFRKYNGQMANHFIQVAPGIDLRKIEEL